MELIHGDCLKQKLPKCRLLLTDIPYGKINRDGGIRVMDKGKADIETFNLQDFLEHIYKCFDVAIIFCGNEQYSSIYEYFSDRQKLGLGSVRQIVWAKSNPSPMNGEYLYLSGTENAVWFKKKGTGKLNSKCKKNYFIFPSGSSKYHPTEKNHKLLEDLILDNTNENDLIIDTCMGSGSTGIVAKKLNREFLGIELDKDYFKVAEERLKKATAQRSIFESLTQQQYKELYE